MYCRAPHLREWVEVSPLTRDIFYFRALLSPCSVVAFFQGQGTATILVATSRRCGIGISLCLSSYCSILKRTRTEVKWSDCGQSIVRPRRERSRRTRRYDDTRELLASEITRLINNLQIPGFAFQFSSFHLVAVALDRSKKLVFSFCLRPR